MPKFQCSACGGPLTVEPEAPTVICPFCGIGALVPEEMRAAHTMLAKTRAPATPPPAANAVAEQASGQAAPTESEGVLLFDDFSDPDTDWVDGHQGDGIEVGYTERGYRIFLGKEASWWEAYGGAEAGEMSIEADVMRLKGPRDGRYGVLARVTNHGAYSFEIDGEGYYGIYKYYYDNNSDTVPLAEGEQDGVVNLEKDAVNTLKGVCHGRHLMFYINGQAVLEAQDDEFKSGDAGLMASTEDSDRGGLDVRFKSLTVREL